MSIFNDLLPELREISRKYVKNIESDLQESLDALEKFSEEYKSGRGRARDTLRGKSNLKTLQIINEDEDEGNKNTASADKHKSDETPEAAPRNTKKRSREMVEGTKSPEQEKRQKRTASAKAQDVITKQVNMSLSTKLRRDGSMEQKREGRSRSGRTRTKNNNKENAMPLPIPVLDIKLERISTPQGEPMDQEVALVEINIKHEVDKDEISMPPPMAPVLKTRKAKSKQEETETRESTSRRSTRSRKQTETLPQPPASTRSTRSSRLTSTNNVVEPTKSPESRPKRTRNKKKQVEQTEPSKEVESEKQIEDTNADSTSPPPQEKARPKRTRKQPAKLREMAAEEDSEKSQITKPGKPEKDEDTQVKSPILVPKQKSLDKPAVEKIETARVDVMTSVKETAIVTDVPALNGTVVLTDSVFDHEPRTPKAINMNEMVTLQSRSTFVYGTQGGNENSTVSKETSNNMTEDESIMTEDNSDLQQTPPKTQPEPVKNPPSAVKEKVQQFEEIASRVTRTKTRAINKKTDEDDTQTPPDKIGIPAKSALSADTLSKMNNLIFNGKTNQISASATKAFPVPISNSKLPSSTTKVSVIAKMREREEELKREKEDARKKKEAMLEAKKELQRRKREEKMAAAAAVRSAAERERLAQILLAEKERQEKLAHLQQGKLEKQKEHERKKQESARKAAEMEERRRAEEQARAAKLAEDLKRADILKKRQQDEAEALKKETAKIAKEMEMRQKEYNEKQRMKQKLESDKVTTPLKSTLNGSVNSCKPAVSPVYMMDGFQYLDSDDEDEQKSFPVPKWSQNRLCMKQLAVQDHVRTMHIDQLFSVRQHSVDLRELFPNIDTMALKRTSSAVWRSPRRPN